MSLRNSGRANPVPIILFLVILLGVGFMVTAYLQLSQEIDQLHGEMGRDKHHMEDDIQALNDQMNKRYLTLLKMAEDQATQQSKLADVERSIAVERDSLTKVEENFQNDLSQVRKAGGDTVRQVNDMQLEFQDDVKDKEVKLAKLEDSYQAIKNQVDDQTALIAMMREQAILKNYLKPPSNGFTTIDIPNPYNPQPNPQEATLTPVNPPAPQNNPENPAPPQPSLLNNRVVTDLPPTTPPVTPVAPPPSTVVPSNPVRGN